MFLSSFFSRQPVFRKSLQSINSDPLLYKQPILFAIRESTFSTPTHPIAQQSGYKLSISDLKNCNNRIITALRNNHWAHLPSPNSINSANLYADLDIVHICGKIYRGSKADFAGFLQQELQLNQTNAENLDRNYHQSLLSLPVAVIYAATPKSWEFISNGLRKYANIYNNENKIYLHVQISGNLQFFKTGTDTEPQKLHEGSLIEVLYTFDSQPQLGYVPRFLEIKGNKASRFFCDLCQNKTTLQQELAAITTSFSGSYGKPPQPSQ